MDLQLTDEQRWLAESVDELLARAGDGDLAWEALVDFGALDVGGDEGLGAVELALVARAVGARVVAAPFAESAAVAYAVDVARAAVAPCLAGRATLADGRVAGEIRSVAYASNVELLAVPVVADGNLALALVGRDEADLVAETTLDPTLSPARVRFDGARAKRLVGDAAVVDAIAAVAGVLVSAEAVGAAATALELARDYASQRRQFGRPIGSFQAVRHILADMYVRVESAWSSVLYAAASLDEREPDAERTTSVAKAYTARATQDVAQNALQVFGGIAFTAEHPAHRYLRRTVARAHQYGTARDHERRLGDVLAESKS